MARVRMVTRTIVETEAQVMRVDTTNAQVSIEQLIITGEYTNAKEVLQAVQSAHDTATMVSVSVQSFEAKETLYGMSEAEFLKLAKVLPPRTKAE